MIFRVLKGIWKLFTGDTYMTPQQLPLKALETHEAISKKYDEKGTAATGNPIYLQLLEEMKQLHLKKAKDYGNDEDAFYNIRASQEIGVPPWLGAWLRAKDKVKRLDRFCIKGELANESMEDSLMDLAAYALIALVMIREERNVPDSKPA